MSEFKKHKINDLNKIYGGGICYSTQSLTGDDIYQTDAWYLLPSRNPTGDGHSDEFEDWHN